MVPVTMPQSSMKRDVMLAARPSGKAHKKLFGSDDERSTTGSTTTASGSSDLSDQSGSGSSDEEEPITQESRSNSGFASWLSGLLRCSRRCSPRAAEKPASMQLQAAGYSNLPVMATRLAMRAASNQPTARPVNQPASRAVNQSATKVVNQPPWRSRRSLEKDMDVKRGEELSWRSASAVFVSPQRKAEEAVKKAEEAVKKAIDQAQRASSWRAAAPKVEAELDSISTNRKQRVKHEGAALLAAAVTACKQGNSEEEGELVTLMNSVAGLSPPPGLSAPADSSSPSSLSTLPTPFSAPPGLAPPPAFETVLFRRELAAILRDLAKDRRAASAVVRVRGQRVPSSKQAAEFADILTRAVEEARGGVRQSIFAFAAGLAAGRPSAFEREECAAGVAMFFDQIYEDLLEEVPRLQTVCMMEMVPTLRSVFSAEELCPFLPEKFHAKMQA